MGATIRGNEVLVQEMHRPASVWKERYWMNPTISVLMPVWNRSRYLPQAIESVLAQTCADWELLVLDDGSTEDTRSVVTAYGDPRIHWLTAPHQGLVQTLNRGLALATGKFIARMDSDDICREDRFDVQLTFMKHHPDIDICGSFVNIIGGAGEPQWTYPQDHESIQAGLLFHNCLAHPTVFIRRETWNAGGFRYDPAFIHAEDYELWDRCAWSLRLAVIPENLVVYRMHENQVSTRHPGAQRASVKRLHERQLRRMRIPFTEDELELHCRLRDNVSQDARDQWIEKLVKHNDVMGTYSKEAFRRIAERLRLGQPAL